MRMDRQTSAASSPPSQPHNLSIYYDLGLFTSLMPSFSFLTVPHLIPPSAKAPPNSLCCPIQHQKPLWVQSTRAVSKMDGKMGLKSRSSQNNGTAAAVTETPFCLIGTQGPKQDPTVVNEADARVT